MNTDRERKALKWMIGIVSFVIWVVVGRGLIFGGDATDASAGTAMGNGLVDGSGDIWCCHDLQKDNQRIGVHYAYRF